MKRGFWFHHKKLDIILYLGGTPQQNITHQSAEKQEEISSQHIIFIILVFLCMWGLWGIFFFFFLTKLYFYICLYNKSIFLYIFFLLEIHSTTYIIIVLVLCWNNFFLIGILFGSWGRPTLIPPTLFYMAMIFTNKYFLLCLTVVSYPWS